MEQGMKVRDLMEKQVAIQHFDQVQLKLELWNFFRMQGVTEAFG
jgi:hypothetical protein